MLPTPEFQVTVSYMEYSAVGYGPRIKEAEKNASLNLYD